MILINAFDERASPRSGGDNNLIRCRTSRCEEHVGEKEEEREGAGRQ